MRRSGSGNGSGLSRTPLTTLKIAVLAPMPRAIVRMATAEKPGFLMSSRAAKRRSVTERLVSASRSWLMLLY